jgi:heme/copper-type cytochrome/quinol oxidase subunit 1
METGDVFILVLFIATLTEFLTERFFGKKVSGEKMVYIAAVIAVALSLGLEADGLHSIGLDRVNIWVDRVLTGLIASAGSSITHQFLSKYLKKT